MESIFLYFRTKKVTTYFSKINKIPTPLNSKPKKHLKKRIFKKLLTKLKIPCTLHFITKILQLFNFKENYQLAKHIKNTFGKLQSHQEQRLYGNLERLKVINGLLNCQERTFYEQQERVSERQKELKKTYNELNTNLANLDGFKSCVILNFIILD